MARGWERLATHEGGTVVALAAAPAGERTPAALFAATATGLFRSVDGAREWSPASAPPLPLTLCVAPSSRFAENGLLFAGAQTGFYRSTDAGQTWRQTLSGGRVFTIAVVPGGEVEERLFIGTERDGILRSDDGGRTWSGANPGLLDLTVLALAFSPDTARDRTGFAATASGLYRTRNGGKAWREVVLPLDEPAVQCVAFSPAFAHDRRVFAGTERDGIWRSDDGGMNWRRVAGVPDGGIGAIAFATRDRSPYMIAVATDAGIARSRDDGATWALTGETLPPVLTLAFVPDGDGETLVAGLYRSGAARLAPAASDDRWTPANTGLTATFRTLLAASPDFARDRALFVGGPEAGLHVSRDGGATWNDTGADFGGATIADIAVAPASMDGISVYVATDSGIRRSRDAGRSWDTPAPDGEATMRVITAGIEPESGAVSLLAATRDGNLLLSDDEGEHWRGLDTPFAGETIVSLALASDATGNRILFVGTVRAAPESPTVSLWRSVDDGGTWARWLREPGGETLPLAVAAGGDNPAIFVGLSGRVIEPRRNAWHTHGGTRSPLWRDASLRTPDGNPATVTALALSPNYANDGAVFAATSAGIYRSRDRGRIFTPWSDGLMPPPILALTVAAPPRGDGDGTPRVFALGVDGTIWQRADDAE